MSEALLARDFAPAQHTLFSDARLELSIAADFIPQVVAHEYGDKASCALTAQLNAHVALGQISGDMAMDAQDLLVTNKDYENYWSTPVYWANNGRRAWTASPHFLANILQNTFGADSGSIYALWDTWNDNNTFEDRTEHFLRSGHVAVVGGRSVVARHARVAFQPAEAPDGMFFLHDQRYPETTGFYPYEELPTYNQGPKAYIYH